MTEPLRAAIYARRSLEQRGVAEEAKSVALQERGARAFILSQGWTLDDTHVYRDDGVSGALWLGRPQFQRMLVDAGADAFDVIVFYKLDRFGRDARKTPVALYGLAELGIKIVPDYTTGEFLDLDTPEGRLKMQFGVELGQGERTNIRKRVRDFAHARVAGGYVAGGGVYGYDIVGTKGTKKRVVNKAQAAVVVDIYTRFSRGDGPYQIAQALNAEGVPSPRKKKDGRTHGWSVTPVRAMLSRPIYRGWIVYGRTGMAYGSELGKKRSSEEKGQIKKPESEWLRVEAQELRIIEPELSARVDAMLTERHSRYLAAREKGSKQRNTEPHGKHLLSGGMLLCPTCDGHFEADQNKRNYVCSVRRRKGRDVCTNELRLPIQETDEQVLSVLAKENGGRVARVVEKYGA